MMQSWYDTLLILLSHLICPHNWNIMAQYEIIHDYKHHICWLNEMENWKCAHPRLEQIVFLRTATLAYLLKASR